jgi:hypothetical protein
MRATPGEVAALSPGTEVCVTYDFGIPVIMGILNMPATDNTGSEAIAVTEATGIGGDGPNRTVVAGRGNYRMAAEPRDVAPGDWVQTAPDGAMAAVLTGGTALIKGSAMAQVRTHNLNDLVEIISRNYRSVTDMGEFNVKNTDGRVNMSFRGASDQRTEAGPDEERWTVKLDIGSVGDLFNFELCTPSGQTLFRLHVDSSGACEIFGVNGVNVCSGDRTGGGRSEEHNGDNAVTINGARDVTIQSDDTLSVFGSVLTTTEADHSVNAGNDARMQATRDVGIASGRNMAISVQGGEGDTALALTVEDGDFVTGVGSVDSLNSAYKVSTYAGALELKSTQGGAISLETGTGNITTNSQTIKLKTSLMDSVVLGGDTLVSHLAKFEELERLVRALFLALDAHTHTASGSPTSQPTAPIGSPLIGMLNDVKSTKAGVSS